MLASPARGVRFPYLGVLMSWIVVLAIWLALSLPVSLMTGRYLRWRNEG